MLRALATVLRPGGRMAFTTIELAADLTSGQRRTALDAAPTAVASPLPYPDLLLGAGFVDAKHEDVTDDYARTLRAWHASYAARLDELRDAEGADAVAERMTGWEATLPVVERGWLLRRRYAARRPR